MLIPFPFDWAFWGHPPCWCTYTNVMTQIGWHRLRFLGEKNEAQRGDTINTDPRKPQEKTASKMHLASLLPLEHQLKARGQQAPDNLFYFWLTGPTLPTFSCSGADISQEQYHH